MRTLTPSTFSALALSLLAAALPAAAQDDAGVDMALRIAREAYVYGFPLVDNYRVMHAYFVDTSNPEYKGAFNQIHNTARVYTPADKAIQTPNSDTPYSMAGLDLRAEPIVLTLPAVDPGRYYSVQLVDLYTFNFDYLGTRTSGNGGGSFLVAGPGWKGETPPGIARVLRSETELVLAVYRTQLFGPDDLPNVEKVQAGYKVQPLSAFLGQPAPPAAPPLAFPAPLSPADERTSLRFFDVLSFVLGLCPVDPSEVRDRERFREIGVIPGKSVDFSRLEPELRRALEAGMRDGQAEIDHANTGALTSADFFGTRAFLKNNFLNRAIAAQLGIYGNSKQEAFYVPYQMDAAGKPLAGAQRYTLHFAKDALPPVDAFWSLTMYSLPDRLLIENPLNRYLINSPMLPALKRDADGGLTLHVQSDAPAKELESNWLPAPKGPFFAVLRLYLPKPAVLDGSWQAPQLTPAN